MKNNKTNKTVTTLYFIAAVCFYIVSIINFINKDTSMGTMFLCFGSTFLCLGSVCQNKDKDKEDK